MSWAPKRFWTAVDIRPEGTGFAVHLDERPVRTPAKLPLMVPTMAVARLVAAEWEAQQGVVRPETMPATRMANSALDKVAPQFDAVVEEIARYGGSDLLCYRAEGPVELVARQKVWDALLDWAASDLEAPLAVTAGVIPVPQAEQALARLRARVRTLTAFELAALYDLVSISGSLILGLAVATRRIDGKEAFALSRIDESYHAEKWGDDEEAAALDDLKRTAFLEAEKFFYCVGDNSAQ